MQHQRQTPNPGEHQEGPAADPAAQLRGWFMEPPYPGVWIGGVLAAVVAALVTTAVITPRRPEPEVQIVARPQVAPVRPPSVPVPSVTTPEETEPAELPKVQVKSLPSAPNAPAGNLPPGNVPPGSAPVSGAANPPGTPAPNAPAPLGEGTPLPELGHEETPPPASAPRGIEPPANPAPLEPPTPEPIPEPEPRRPERPRPPAPAPERASGRMAIFFDADSTTFDRRGRRLPLRVEVYVDGRKVLESDDPEKQEFSVGRLRDGWHDVEIVPYVANAPSDPRRQRVYIEAGSENRFKAVLRREDGASRVSKFRERD